MSKAKKVLIFSGVGYIFLLIIVCTTLMYRYFNEEEEPTSTTTTQKELREDDEDDEDEVDIENDLASNDETYQQLYRDPLVTPVGNGNDQVTVMIYMNGSNLESDHGLACDDISEMLSANLSDKVNVVIQTMGTRHWHQYNIASDHTQRYHIEDKELVLVDDSLSQLNCTDPDTLSSFIIWSKENYPADRYFLILWNHGGGSVEGFGYDEFGSSSDSLYINEMQTALEDGGVVFDFIGMDACIMSSVEVCYALYDYCDYMILSEDFESGLGWFYGRWLSQLAAHTSIDVPTLAQTIIDDMVAKNEENRHQGSSSTLALIDQRYIPAVFDMWIEFAYANEETLLNANYSREVVRSERALPIDPKVDSEFQAYGITDMLAVVASINSTYTKSLSGLLGNAIVYYNYTSNNAGLTGLSVTLPYGDYGTYRRLCNVYEAAGIDSDYIAWLEKIANTGDLSNPFADSPVSNFGSTDWEENTGVVEDSFNDGFGNGFTDGLSGSFGN